MLASVRSRPMARPAAEACGYPPPLVLRLAQRPGAAGPAGLSRWAREHRLSCGSMGPALADRKALSAHRRRCEAVCRYARTAIAASSATRHLRAIDGIASSHLSACAPSFLLFLSPPLLLIPSPFTFLSFLPIFFFFF